MSAAKSNATARGHSCETSESRAPWGMHYSADHSDDGETLTEKQRRFVEAYMGEAAGNGTLSAKIAGYSAKNAHAEASRLLRNAKVRAAIQARQASDPLVMTREAMMRRLSAIGRGDAVVRLCDRTTGEPVAGADGSYVHVPATVSVQIKAMEMLARVSGWFKEADDGNDRLAAFLAALQSAQSGASQ